jgi:hypothetical protein
MKLSLARARVNAKSLAAEAAIIKKEMGKLSLLDQCDLRSHRIHVVRPEARLANLAIGFLKGKKKTEVEKSEKPLDFKRLYDKLRKFDPRITKDQIVDWLNSAVPISSE